MVLGRAVLVASLLLASSCLGLQSITRVGRHLYGANDSNRFFIKVRVHE